MPKFEIKMPKLGESITEGTIISWSVKVGDHIKEDDVLFEVNTAKVSAEIPSPVEGKILEILHGEGDTVAVGVVVAIVQLGEEGEETIKEKEEKVVESKVSEPPTPATVSAPILEAPAPILQASAPIVGKPLKHEESERWYSPVVLAKAQEAGIDKDELELIPGTGYSGRLSKRDIEQYIQRKKDKTEKPATTRKEESVAAPAMATKPEDRVIPMDAVRRIIADRMVASKNISAHVTSVIEADVTNLVKWREQNKDAFQKREGISLTYMPVITEAVASALAKFPRVNSSVDGYNIIEKKQINVGIAVSLDDGNLIVPVVKNADQLSIKGLALSISSLAGKARRNSLAMDDIQGGTFTITNFGSFKSLFGTPIINQPEVAILGVGTIEKKPSVIETPSGDMIAIRQKMYLALSYDHRVIDGALAGNFLKYLADYLENWNMNQ